MICNDFGLRLKDLFKRFIWWVCIPFDSKKCRCCCLTCPIFDDCVETLKEIREREKSK